LEEWLFSDNAYGVGDAIGQDAAQERQSLGRALPAELLE
jgi:hypothetical protein